MSTPLTGRQTFRLAGALLVFLVGCSSSGDPTAGGTSSEGEGP